MIKIQSYCRPTPSLLAQVPGPAWHKIGSIDRAGIPLDFPMEGIKSTSIVWKQPESLPNVDATALFCGEDDCFGTHLESATLDRTEHCTFVGLAVPITFPRNNNSNRAPFSRTATPMRPAYKPPSNPFRTCRPFTDGEVGNCLPRPKRARGRAHLTYFHIWDAFKKLTMRT